MPVESRMPDADAGATGKSKTIFNEGRARAGGGAGGAELTSERER
jgi:hypothetical protein